MAYHENSLFGSFCFKEIAYCVLLEMTYYELTK